LCEPGQDASSKVDALANTLGKQLLQIAMGSAEGYTEAERLIALGSKTGAWVLLRNVHLCIDWLSLLEKKLHSSTPHENYRLFMTCEMHPRLPSPLLRLSEVVVFEASTGIKANLHRFYSSIPVARIDKLPHERSRLYGLLAWFHAVVQARLRYSPLGWTKKYEFTEIDAQCALDVIDHWVDDVAGSKSHINPVELPWEALRTLLSQSLYGGRIDHNHDQVRLLIIFQFATFKL
jgi:dynein heavy chain 1